MTMTLFDSLERIRQLPPSEQAAFEDFYRHQERYRLLPFLLDVSFALALIGTFVHLLKLGPPGSGPEGVHGPTYLYFAFICGLAALHRWTRLRSVPPLGLYVLFALMALFHYLGFVVEGGGIVPVFGLLFFLTSIGLVTLSLRHTLTILALNLVLLAVSSFLVAKAEPATTTLSVMMPVLTHWFTLAGLLMAPLVAVVSRRLFRTLFALQYLLTDTLRSLKQTESRLIQEQKHQALSHMAKGLLHEIMNPLNCSSQALNFARQAYAQQPDQDEELVEALTDAADQQHRIVRIISDLRSFSAASPPDASEQANVLKLIDKARHLCRHELKGIDVKVQAPEQLSVRCYPTSLIQVFVNLLLNSVAALSSDSQSANRRTDKDRPRIDITCIPPAEPSQGSEQHIKIRVRDNGEGIAAEDLPYLMEPGTAGMRAVSSPSPEQNQQPLKSGLNLGLGICQTIMRHHRGTFSITSERGAWTEVTLRLPHTLHAPPR